MTSVAMIFLAVLLGVLTGFLIWRGRPRASSNNLILLADSLPDPILLIGSDDRIVLVNRPGEKLFDLESSKLVGQNVLDVVLDPEMREWFQFIRFDPPQIRELRLTRHGQLLSFQPLIVRASAGDMLVVLRDISTLAGAVQMKTDFVANASHELRTPISAIKVAFDTLREVYHDDRVQAERCMTIIGGHLTRLEETLRDLLDLARVENPDLNPRFTTIDSNELFSQIRSTWTLIALDRNIRLELPESSSITFRSDRRLLDLVMKNLLENAIKFTPPNGTVSVTIERRNDAGEIELKVSDTGCGIPPEHVERVFERFYQVDSARSSSTGRGTGLGLAIVKHAIHALGGTVRLTSQTGKGTTAICILPQRTERESIE